MQPSQILGAVILVVGIVLLIFAIQASDAPAEQITEAVTGRYTQRTMWYWILGVAGIVGGGLLLVFGRRR
jgi:choline-glycine betaine transporter